MFFQHAGLSGYGIGVMGWQAILRNSLPRFGGLCLQCSEPVIPVNLAKGYKTRSFRFRRYYFLLMAVVNGNEKWSTRTYVVKFHAFRCDHAYSRNQLPVSRPRDGVRRVKERQSQADWSRCSSNGEHRAAKTETQ